MFNPDFTSAYIASLTGNPDTVMDWRVINDRQKGLPAHNIRASYPEARAELERYNSEGWGVFTAINAMDGKGFTLNNVSHIRTHVLDLDDPATSQMDYARVIQTHPIPHFAVQTSADKLHIYWLVEPYQGNEFYTLHQKKIAQLFNGDRSINDAARVMRVPGFLHHKNEPVLVTCWGVGQHGRYTYEQIQQGFQHVNVVEHFSSRAPLGDPMMQAPSFEWLVKALNLLNPNELDRAEWLSISAAFKQAGWTLTDPDTLYNTWVTWCASYKENDEQENRKMWNSIKDTEVGWAAFERRTNIKAWMGFGGQPAAVPNSQPTVQKDEFESEILDAEECKKYFKDCYYIEREGKIFTPKGRYMNSALFNGAYGGKIFIITNNGGKTTDEPWKAALRSTIWTIPKVDHVRFLPDKGSFAIIEDELGRKGLNTYIPARIKRKQGDVSPWLRHLSLVISNEQDRKIWEDYFAHCIKYPGWKIPWSPMLQSIQGVGKQLMADVMRHCVGSSYVYQPNAKELAASGNKFNAWMRGKLMIIVDEIRVDERRDLYEVLKPMITDKLIEVQAKGVDQDMEDNVSNWIFFTNYKDAIPIDKNDRRYAIFYSDLQQEHHLVEHGMDKDYFDNLRAWLYDQGGLEHLADYYLSYNIAKDSLPHRAPHTSSKDEAIRISRSPIEVVLLEAVDDGMPGFRSGFVSMQALTNKVRSVGMRTPAPHTLTTLLEKHGYFQIGKNPNIIMQEDANKKSLIFARDPDADINQYERTQGYK